MAKIRSQIGAGLVAGALAVTLTACGSSSSSGGVTGKKGGTVTLINVAGTYEGTDPASVYLGEEMASLRRLTYRSLVAFPISADDKVSGTPQPDLATDAGTPSNGAKDWKFTLKKGVKWQDGKDVTPADLAYGLSRSFDSTLVNGTGVGTTYLASYNLGGLFKADGSTDYPGPLTATPAQQKEYDTKAYTIDGDSITYHFSSPWPDFPQQIAALFTFDPYEKSVEQGAKGLWAVNSDGPYKLQGSKFDTDKGATFVRNTAYDASTDSASLRGAFPDQFVFEMVADQPTVIDRLIADSGKDQTAFSTVNIDSTHYGQVTGLGDRVLPTKSPYTRFLEFNALKMTNPKIRRALVLATNKNGFITANGGPHWGDPSSTIVSNSTPGFTANPVTQNDNPAGDPAAARKLLTEAGVSGTYPITFAFRDSSPAIEKAAAILKSGWDAAGFKTTLQPISPDAKPSYYASMSAKVKSVDVFYAGWAADWPTLLATVQPILLSNPPAATNGVGFNYGFYSNKDVDAQIDAAKATTDTNTQITDLNKADALAGTDAAYVPLAQQKNWFVYGSNLGGFIPDVASSYYPDLGGLYVK